MVFFGRLQTERKSFSVIMLYMVEVPLRVSVYYMGAARHDFGGSKRILLIIYSFSLSLFLSLSLSLKMIEGHNHNETCDTWSVGVLM